MQLINLQGECVFQKSVFYSSTQEGIDLDLSNYHIQKGIYSMLIFDGDQSYQQRIIIKK